MKIHHLLLKRGHRGVTFEPDVFIWNNTFYCEECKDRKKIVARGLHNLNMK